MPENRGLCVSLTAHEGNGVYRPFCNERAYARFLGHTGWAARGEVLVEELQDDLPECTVLPGTSVFVSPRQIELRDFKRAWVLRISKRPPPGTPRLCSVADYQEYWRVKVCRKHRCSTHPCSMVTTLGRHLRMYPESDAFLDLDLP